MAEKEQPEAGDSKPAGKEGKPKEGKQPKEAKQAGKPAKEGAGDKKGKPDKGKPAPPPKPTVPARLQERYHKEILKQLVDKLHRTNPHSLPKLQKIVVNMGCGKA